MIADLNVHWDMAEDGSPKPHAHVMLTMREVDEDGFGPKVRDWNRTEVVERWREAWAEPCQRAPGRTRHRRADRPSHPGSAGHRAGAAEPDRRARATDRGRRDRGRRTAEDAPRDRTRNGARIIADPRFALDAITRQQSTFTRRDMAKFAHRQADGMEQFNAVTGAVRASPDLVGLGKDGRGEERFTTRDMIEVERAAAPRRRTHGGTGTPPSLNRRRQTGGGGACEDSADSSCQASSPMRPWRM